MDIKMTRIQTLGIGLALLSLIGLAEARDGIHAAQGIKDQSLVGIWDGTIAIQKGLLSPFDQRVILTIREDGTFYCATHDLVSLELDSPSVGFVEEHQQTLVFTMDTPEGPLSHSFLFYVVDHEKRDPTVPMKLYLHDVDMGVNLHLTPVASPTPR